MHHSPDDFAEFEDEVADIPDPSPFDTRGPTPNAQRVFELMSEVVGIAVEDIVGVLNEGNMGLIQYLNPRNGVTITVLAQDPHNLLFKAQTPPDHGGFLSIERVTPEP